MAALVNIDYEIKLFQEGARLFESNRINQELEYLLFWVEPTQVLWSTKRYSEDYLRYVKNEIGVEPKIQSELTSSVTHWWGSYSDIEYKRKVNSKATCWEILKQRQLLPAKSEKLSHYPESLDRGFVYKECINFSGKGFVTNSLSSVQKLKLPIIKEPILNRKYDLSYLNAGGNYPNKVIENFVDQKFQYKGTLLSPCFSFPNKFADDLEKKIVPILQDNLSLNLEEVWSIDSFIYQEQNELKLYPATEINYRKTMGFVAIALKQKLADSYEYFMFLLRKRDSTNVVWQNKSVREAKGGVLCLSPEDTLFQCMVVYGESEEQLNYYKRQLD